MSKGKVWLLMDNRKRDLSNYHLSQAEDSIKVAQMSLIMVYIKILLIVHIMRFFMR